MRPTLAIVPLALLLAWFGPSPSGEMGLSGLSGLSSLSSETAPSTSSMPASLSQAEALAQPELSASEQLAAAWASIQRSGFLRTSAEVPQRR